MKWPHTWHCERASGGTQDTTSGAWTPGVKEVIYSGLADCQDGGREIARDGEGHLVVRAPAVLYLKERDTAQAHRVGDVGVVTWEDGTTDDAEVALIDRLSNLLELRWV